MYVQGRSMNYQTYGALAISPVVLCSMHQTTINLAGIGEIQFTPMLNIRIWPGATILCSWDSDILKNCPKAMYLVDSEGIVHQFFGMVDTLVLEGNVFDLTTPYSQTVYIAENVLEIAVNAHHNEVEKWWNEYINCAILMNLHGSDLMKFAVSLATQYNWSQDIVSKIKNINPKFACSPLHRARRLHFQVIEHECLSPRHTG